MSKLSKAEEEWLYSECTAENLKAEADGFILPVYFSLGSALTVVGNMQLALRHPENSGLAARAAREIIDQIIQRVDEEGFGSTARLMRMGDDPQYDRAGKV